MKIKEVTVSGRKGLDDAVLQSSRLDSVLIANSKDENLSELLANNTSVFIKSYGKGSLATASFRGTGASHTKVLWNGISLNSPMLGQVDFSLIPVTFVDEVNIYHGGSSIHINSGSLGGSIVVNNKPDWSTPFSLKADQSIASFHSFQTLLSIKAGRKRIQSKSKFLYLTSENDFKFYNNSLLPHQYSTQKNSDYQRYGYLQEIYLRMKDHSVLSLRLWHQKNVRNLPPIMSNESANYNENQEDKSTIFVARYEKYNEQSKFSFQSGMNMGNLNYYLLNKTLGGNFMGINSVSKILSFFNKINHEIWFNPTLKLSSSIDANHHDIENYENVKKTGYEKGRGEVSLYTRLNKLWYDRLNAFVCIRQDFLTTEKIPVIPSIGMSYKLLNNSDLFLKTNISRNYHVPSLNDLYWVPGGNPELKPEEGLSSEISIESIINSGLNKTEIEFTGYHSVINDWILWQPSEFRYWVPQNIKKVISRGIELKAKTEGNIIGFSYQFHSCYSFTSTTNQSLVNENDVSKGEQLIYVPKHTINSFFSVSRLNYFINISMNYVGIRYTSTGSNYKLPAYMLNDLSLGKKIRLMQYYADISLKVNNLFNVNYQAMLWRAMPGRNFSLHIGLGF